VRRSDLLATVETYRESLTEAVDAGPAPIQLPVFHDDRDVSASYTESVATYETAVLIKRRYTMPAPWAIREFRYVANVFVWIAEPDTPLIYGEWKPWYRFHEMFDPKIPRPENPYSAGG
jgi:hypothetical protein